MRVAFCGLGIMGSRMATNLRAAGHDVVVWNRTRSRADELGAPVAGTPAEAARDAEVVITMVVDGPQVEAVLLGEDDLGLTPREREVLALLAEGRTNREIGEALFMAEKTASVHVSRILAKLDVRSRTEAAAVAHRLGLVAA